MLAASFAKKTPVPEAGASRASQRPARSMCHESATKVPLAFARPADAAIF